ncbi:TPA: phage head spike fiber domain-containing protein [Aeromonas hydrophila]
MASTNQGDDAVARLDAAVTAFEDILTGPEGQTVPVPGKNPQPTLAERVKQNLKPSTDAAAGFAVQAAASAKAADDAAKLASQISGLATVADAIGLATLPLPDVWAPLSDSLRLITGYGRDVLVGSDVVARMVNFSRSTTATYIGKDGQLKTAAANEPRFEREGLLIEGQSTNLVPSSEGTVYAAGNSGFQTITNGVSGVLPVVGQRIAFSPNAGEANSTLSQFSLTLQGGQTYTFSCFMKIEQGSAPQIPENSLAAYSTATTTTISRNVVRDLWNGVYRVALTFSVGGTGSQQVYLRFSRGGAASESWVGVVGGSQVENLPFASSYIPTSGAAVTRTQDLAWLPAYGNEPLGLVMSIAAEVDLLGKGLSSWPRPYELSDSENKGGHIVMASGSWDGADLVGKKTTVALRFSDRSHWAAGAKRPSQWNGYLNQLYTGNIYLFGTTNPARAFYGHVRNIRAWFVLLSDDQHKAIK